MADTKKVDGYASFAGGMDSSRSPSLLASNQYVYSVNCVIPKSSEGIETRKGFRCLTIDFTTTKEKEIFESGNPHGSGWFHEDNKIILIYVVNGYIFRVVTKHHNRKFAEILNQGNQFDPLKRCWITTIPGGCIVNNGQDAPYYITRFNFRQTRPDKREIGAGLMGVYVQNRFWYVTPNRKEIWSSTIKQPLSLEEAIIDNIYGVYLPEDDKNITAVGKQATIGRDAVGGNLAFATQTDFYTVDVRGARTAWGAASGIGFVDNTLPGLGAASGHSFETFNGNIYFRNKDFGLVSLNQGRSEFANKDAFSKQTIEASAFFDRDTSHLLDWCHTKGYGKSIFTTVAPSYKDGFVYWNGIIVKTPDPYYGRQSQENNYSDIVESVWTGVRPWNIITTDFPDTKFFVLSYDCDGVNRLYMLDETLTHDLNKDRKPVAIESKVLTRSMDFKNPFLIKNETDQLYSVGNLLQDTEIKISYRSSDYGKFKEIWLFQHKRNSDCVEERKIIPIPRNNEDFFAEQNLIEFKGYLNIRRLIKQADLKPYPTQVPKQSSEPVIGLECDDSKIFTYQIV